VIAVWFLPSQGLEIPQRAFWRTVGILAPVGFLLDFVFARWFFCFPNRGATLGIPAPALGHPVPVEEYIFYLSGFVMILLLYVWLSEYWLVAYSVPDYVGETRTMRRLLRFHPTSLIVGLVLVVLSILFKKWISPAHDGWPGYFIVLVVGGLVPSISFFPTTCRFINWRALSLTLFLVSSAYQPTLGGNTGFALRMVELSASPDDGAFHRPVGQSPYRGSLCLACRRLWDHHPFRGG
jgi:hypothetical protein